MDCIAFPYNQIVEVPDDYLPTHGVRRLLGDDLLFALDQVGYPEPFYDIDRNGITQGALAKWLVCPEKARLGLIEGFSGFGEVSYALEFGNICHKVLEDTYTRFSEHITTEYNYSAHDMPRIMKEYLTHQYKQAMLLGSVHLTTQVAFDKLDLHYGLAESVLDAYFQCWSDDFTDFEWVSLEYEFNVPCTLLIQGKPIVVFLRGKIDGVYKDRDGEYWLFETKTKGNISTDSLVDRLGFDLQTGMYSMVAEHLFGKRPKGVLYNLILRPQHRQKQNETTGQFISRVRGEVFASPFNWLKRLEVQITTEEVIRFRGELAATLQGFVMWYLGEYPNYRNSTQCHNGLWACEFLQFCSGTDATRFSQRDSVYPELSTLPQEKIAT